MRYLVVTFDSSYSTGILYWTGYGWHKDRARAKAYTDPLEARRLIMDRLTHSEILVIFTPEDADHN